MKTIKKQPNKPISAILLATAALIFILGTIFIRYYTDYAWYKYDAGYTNLFWTYLKTRWLLFTAGFLISGIFAWVNWYPVVKLVNTLSLGANLELDPFVIQAVNWLKNSSKRIVTLFAIIVGLVFGSSAAGTSDMYLRFIHSVNFETVDPVFGKNIAFYMFQLDFIRYMLGFALWLVVLVGAVVVAVYFSSKAIGYFGSVSITSKSVKAHCLLLLSVLFFLVAGRLFLYRYEYLFGQQSLFFGAAYTDVIIRLPILYGVVAGCVLLGISSIVNIWVGRSFTPVIRGTIGLVVLTTIAWGVFPLLFEQVVVSPNQFGKEEPYVQRNITMTRTAFGLDKIEVRNAPYSPEPTIEELNINKSTLENMRVWDPRIVIESYNNLQALGPYYHFRENGSIFGDDNGVDVDRYVINGSQRVTMLAVRELDQKRLTEKAKTWQNEKLLYTHGYGLVMTQVNKTTPEGGPLFITQNMPPQGPEDLAIKNPGIYFGEVDNGYVLVNTSLKELDYPTGESGKVAETQYAGKTGIPIGSNYLSRLMFSLKLADSNIVLSTAVQPNTKLLLNRTITERTRLMYPFLTFDPDPYIVIADGQLYWVLDAYTTGNKYPYSNNYALEDQRKVVNYIRNSVKIVINAYDGTMNAYIVDPNDPILKVYQNIFPDLFKPFDTMAESIKSHIRYPEKLFLIQAAMYRFYHITDTKVFYQKEDAWAIPQENLNVDTKVQMRPYYVQMSLPDLKKEGFHLILPFTPLNRQNLVGWLSAGCDKDQYGQLVVYRFPDNSTVPGPEIVYSRFQQNPEISQKMSLWNSAQGGSNTLFGNMIVTPIGKSLIYIQPIFLRATNQQGQSLPQLVGLMASVGDKTTIASNFDDAIKRLIPQYAEQNKDKNQTSVQPVNQIMQPETPVSKDEQMKKLIQKALLARNTMNDAMKRGDWTEYGKQWDILKVTLDEMDALTGK